MSALQPAPPPAKGRHLSRRSAIKAICRAAGIATWAHDLKPVRGRCQHGRCPSRWAIPRVTLDLREERVERVCTLECASCGRTWRRVKVPPIRSRHGYQAVRLTLILRNAAYRRWRSRGHWHREGDDSIVLVDADLGDLDEAMTAHDKRAARLADMRARRKARIDAENAALIAGYREREAAYAARREEVEREEREAAAREAANAR